MLECTMNLGSKELKNIVDSASCILLDIEGTTTSIDFVRKDLFNYGIQNVQQYVSDNWNEPQVQKVIKELIIPNSKEETASCDNTSEIEEALINKLKTEMKSNQKSPAVKDLEGLVCMTGFIKGELIGHLYPDVFDGLQVWNSQGKKIYIYSNGSVQSQCLLFKQNIHGDLRKYIDGNFDTNIGSKLDPASYSKICQTVGKLPNEVVFFSDRPQELIAAKQAGLNIILVVRNPECPMFVEEMCHLQPTDPTVNSFLEVLNNYEKEK